MCVPEGVVLAADRSLGTSFTLSQTTALSDLAFCYHRALSLPTLLPNKQPIPKVMDASGHDGCIRISGLRVHSTQ